LDVSNKLLEYYDIDGSIDNSFIYNLEKDNFISQPINTKFYSESRMSVGACTKRCVESIYDYGSWGGITLIVISAVQPETFIAVVIGCRIGCR
jgi:hypothetical protein